MSGLVRKLTIFAGENGLILQPHGSEHRQSIRVEYKSRNILPQARAEPPLQHKDRLDSYGVIGLLHIASHSFLIAITGRRQVAQIFGKPVYTITKVVTVPLSSQTEAHDAILAASKNQLKDNDPSDSDYSNTEDGNPTVTSADTLESFEEDQRPYSHQNRSDTSFAEDVAKRKATYGRSASQWFLRQMPDAGRSFAANSQDLAVGESEDKTKGSNKVPDDPELDAAHVDRQSPSNTTEADNVTDLSTFTSGASVTSFIPKILRNVKMILSSQSFYFAYDFDLTRKISLQYNPSSSDPRENPDVLFFWNRRMGHVFTDARQNHFLVPIVQGFVGQRSFCVKSSSVSATSATTNVKDTRDDSVDAATCQSPESTMDQRAYLLTLISRRSVKRSGLRYLRRGIDDEGHCANTVETEQVLSSPLWDTGLKIRSFVQLRGSIPLYFSQSSYSFKPLPMLHNSPSANQAAFKKHFQSLQDQYGAVQIASLVDKHGTEMSIGNAYENLHSALHEANQLSDVSFKWFDFHSECRGMKFENVQRLANDFSDKIANWGETVVLNGSVKAKQSGVIRTNCMDCLDRTNVAQSAFGQHVLQRALKDDGFAIDLLHDESTNWFNALWADNGDAISRQYAGTAALKGDFTRTRKRNWRGQVNDLGLTLSRYYSNTVNDYFSQAVIDVLLGNVSWRVFEDFETSMMSVDPGISIQAAREAAIESCTKIAIQDPSEDLIHGWVMLTPAQDNTLRTMPLEEAVVLLTDAAIYCCRFDWDTEKIASFEKVDLRSISKIRLGIYITSTFTERQLDEQLNQGIVIVFTPGKNDVIRVNTRSLANAIDIESQRDKDTSGRPPVDGGTGILSWLSPRGSSGTSRMLALKVIAGNTITNSDDQAPEQSAEKPYEIATRISEEIVRAMGGPDYVQNSLQFIERGDIISVANAKQRTGFLEQISHSIKKLVWA